MSQEATRTCLCILTTKDAVEGTWATSGLKMSDQKFDVSISKCGKLKNEPKGLELRPTKGD